MWFYDSRCKNVGFGTHFEFYKHAVLNDVWNLYITLINGNYWFKSLDSIQYQQMLSRCKLHNVSYNITTNNKEE